MLKKSQLARTAKKTNRTITFWLLVGSLSVFFPLYMTIMIAFKDPSQMSNSIAGILAFPKSWSFDNFQQAMAITDFWHTLSNSILITGATMIVAVIFHSLIGYAIGRSMQKRGYRLLYLYIISGMFVPFAIIMMPIVKQTAMLGIDNRFGVVLLYSIFYLPMNLMLYTGYLKNIPLSLEEAAAIDGASTFKTFWSVIFPLMKPMHATVAVLTALGTWNDVMLPLVLLSGTGQNTLPIAQLNFQSQFGTNYNLAFASYLLALIPMLIIYIIGQKQIIKGVVNGAIK
ncbi:MAG: carbohydrate ABC transporter permease [Erysipelotrichaceae bacterium]|nr:carbohydrate ABC transporter permease [Erysipelotrichaceae bacterium]